MKKLFLPLVAVALTTAAHAQSTWVAYPVTTFQQSSPGVYKGSTNVVVGTNVLARMVNAQTAGNVTDLNVIIQNPGLPPVPANWVADSLSGAPVLGPCVITVTFSATTTANTLGLLLVQFDPVNGTASPNGNVALPAGFSGSVSLQTSSDLANWQTMTNAPFGKSSGNRFFRTALTIP